MAARAGHEHEAEAHARAIEGAFGEVEYLAVLSTIFEVLQPSVDRFLAGGRQHLVDEVDA